MLTRHTDPRVTPLEIWDVLVDGTPLHAVPRGPDFPAALARMSRSLIAGSAVGGASTRFPPACRDIVRVALVGGAAEAIAWPRDALPRLHVPRAEHCAERGGRAILTRASLRGLVVDLGQSRLKIASEDRRWSHPRDLLAIPISGRPVDGRGRAALVKFFAGALREAAAHSAPQALVLALPCEVAANGALGTCSYPWRAGEPIVPELLAAAGLADLPTWLLNDAELAAIGVAEPSPPPGVTLVLTLGFGVGAALLRSSA
jgi:hypothetical protein